MANDAVPVIVLNTMTGSVARCVVRADDLN